VIAGFARKPAERRGRAGYERSRFRGEGEYAVRRLIYIAIAVLLTSCVPIGVRVQNMFAFWTG